MLTILVAEDNALNLELLSTILLAHSYGVITACNGEDAVIAAETELPDLILMDIQMPGLDGHEALTLIRANPKTQHIPVIAVTGNAMPHDLKKIEESGFNGIVNKPFKINELLQVIQRSLRAK